MSKPPLIVLVHPGSLCGSLQTAHDWHPKWREYARLKRNQISTEFLFFAGRRAVIFDGELDDELPNYPALNRAVEAADEAYKAKSNDEELARVARRIWRRHTQHHGEIIVSGGWADRTDGCAWTVYATLRKLAHGTSARIRLSPLAARYDVAKPEIERGPVNPLGQDSPRLRWHVARDPEAFQHNENHLAHWIRRSPGWRELGKRLKLIGGLVVCATLEEDLDLILSDGRTWVPRQKDVQMARGQKCRCHENVLYLWEANPHLEVWTGWALSNDGIWRGHSWCFEPKTWTIIETTDRRLAYHGARLSVAQSRQRLEEAM